MKHLLFSILVLLAAPVAFSHAQAAEPKPNIIVILADDLGYGDLACYGGDGVATPHLDRMAQEGAKFTSFYAAPVCSPMRASLMTGSIAQRVGIGGRLKELARKFETSLKNNPRPAGIAE